MKSTASTANSPEISGSLKRLVIWILILACWETAYRLIHWPPWRFPAPSHVIQTACEIFTPLLRATATSGLRLLVGFAASVLCGVILGAVMWRWRAIDQFLGPLFLGLQTLPSVCWVPLAILLFGLTERAILFVLVVGSFAAVSISLRDGLRTIPPLYERAGQMLGARGWRLYRYVMLPASLPALAGSLRHGFSFAWRSLMGAEVIFAVERHGLGWLLQTGRDYNDVAQVVAVMIVMVLIGMTVDRFAFARIERLIAARFGLAN